MDLTDKQLRALELEAEMAGDPVMADMCRVARRGEDSDGTGTVLGLPLTAADALAACKDAIEEAKANDDRV